jgi:16S rRNA (guanine(966)-N(2))-methyltransferase RsmD
MRIISGTAGGRKLLTPGGMQIRPTADRAREALFSILAGTITDCRFVDLFAGTGAVGLEALSRGAASCLFVDFHHKACSLIHDNCCLCHLDADSVILKRDLRRNPHYLQKLDYTIDILFMDPPYNKGFSRPLFTYLDKNGSIFSPTATLVIEENDNVDLPDQGTVFTLETIKKYGEAVFRIYKKWPDNND